MKLVKILKTSGLFFVLSLFLTPFVNAQVIINEINASEEWVELFRQNDTDLINLDNCTIYFHASKSQKKLLTTNDNFSDGELFKIINTDGSYLSNSDSDTVWIECADFQTSQAIYPDNISAKSYARIPNGIGNFVLTTDITKNAENPNPTPEPTLAPTVSPTNSPTHEPTIAPTSTPTVKPVPTKTPTQKPTVSPTPTEEPEPSEEPDVEIQASIELETNIPIATGLVAGASTENKSKAIAIVFIAVGVLFLGYCGYLIYNGKNEELQKNS